MHQQDFLKNQFLIAMPSLVAPPFNQTVTYIWEHDSNGAAGIVLNRPLEVTLGDVLEQLSLEAVDARTTRRPVFFGGPVEPQRGFVIHEPPGAWETTLPVDASLGITVSQDVLAAIAAGRGPKKSLVALGYAGWGAGQLETELAHNAWLSTPADSDIIFNVPPEQRWERAARLLGVDVRLLTGDAGHG
jgi:putative transcriptional regulator